MSKTTQTDADLRAILANQQRLDSRLLWLFMLPFLITAVTVAMFFTISARLTDVEVGTKLVTIERILESDKNYAWAVDQYERIAASYSKRCQQLDDHLLRS